MLWWPLLPSPPILTSDCNNKEGSNCSPLLRVTSTTMMNKNVVCLCQPFAKNGYSAGYQLSCLGSVLCFLQVLCQYVVFDYVSNPVGEVILFRICVKDIGLVRHTVEVIPKLFHALQDKAIMASEYVLIWHVGQKPFCLLFQCLSHILYFLSFSSLT